MTRTLADEVRELQDRLVKILEDGASPGWGDLVNNVNARQDALYKVQEHITKAMEFHIRHEVFGDEYLNHVDEAMKILYEILKQHNRL